MNDYRDSAKMAYDPREAMAKKAQEDYMAQAQAQPPDSQVQSAISALEGVLFDIRERVDILGRKLEPVRNTPPTGDGCEDNNPYVSHSPIVEQINSIADRGRSVCASLAFITSTLEV